MDNCSGHNETSAVDDALRRINTEMLKFLANATDLLQPSDSFVISKLKYAWRKKWDLYKTDQMSRRDWMGSGSGQSGNLENPGSISF